MKKGDIIKFKMGITDETQEGKVNWVKNGDVGISLLGDKHGAATVMSEEDCEVVVEYKGDTLKDEVHSMETEELKAAIQRLKGMRFPRRVASKTRSSVSPNRRQKLTRLLEAIDGDPSVLDTLIDKALKEEKNEGNE